MKRAAILSSLILLCLTMSATALGQAQKGCQLNIVGTWNPDEESKVLYRFAADGTVTVLSVSGQESRELGSAAYTLDNPRAPKALMFKAAKQAGGLAEGTTALEITGYDDTSLTLVKPGSGPSRWVKVDTNRYFMVLAGRSNVFYDSSGPTFPMLIKLDGQQAQIDAVGIYAIGDKWHFGTIPADTYRDFMKEPAKASDVMLRLEITGAQYERGLNILRTWERRVREGALLYPDLFLDNILLVKQVTETLNQCGETVKLYKLDWSLNDHISEHNSYSRAPFMYFKELRRLNESLHVRDEKFPDHGRMAHKAMGR
jgi:hypothetical protein